MHRFNSRIQKEEKDWLFSGRFFVAGPEVNVGVTIWQESRTSHCLTDNEFDFDCILVSAKLYECFCTMWCQTYPKMVHMHRITVQLIIMAESLWSSWFRLFALKTVEAAAENAATQMKIGWFECRRKTSAWFESIQGGMCDQSCDNYHYAE